MSNLTIKPKQEHEPPIVRLGSLKPGTVFRWGGANEQHERLFMAVRVSMLMAEHSDVFFLSLSEGAAGIAEWGDQRRKVTLVPCTLTEDSA